MGKIAFREQPLNMFDNQSPSSSNSSCKAYLFQKGNIRNKLSLFCQKHKENMMIRRTRMEEECVNGGITIQELFISTQRIYLSGIRVRVGPLVDLTNGQWNQMFCTIIEGYIGFYIKNDNKWCRNTQSLSIVSEIAIILLRFVAFIPLVTQDLRLINLVGKTNKSPTTIPQAKPTSLLAFWQPTHPQTRSLDRLIGNYISFTSIPQC